MDMHEVMILLERIESTVQLVAEGVAANADRHEQASVERRELAQALEQNHLRLRRVESRLDSVESRLDKVEDRLDGIENQMTEMKQSMHSIRHTTGLLHTIARAHEHRLLDVESGLQELVDAQP